ncbi:MAG: type I glutamate--ammonia ligase, partial [Proteobacteria bacterium]|nr:type I glutamate--ammonia ligase [Pseudomonadota bacterium]
MLSFANVQEVKDYVAAEEIRFIGLYLADIDGRLRNVTIPAQNFSQRTLDLGVGFDASNLGFANIERSDMIMVPDMEFAFRDPVREYDDTLFFFCNLLSTDSHTPFTEDLRHIVRKALAALDKAGIANEAKILVELEFNVIDSLYSVMTPRETAYRVESVELANPPDGTELYRIYKKHGYFRAEPNDHLYSLRN